jgi:cysteinyl-tRNA synthetase
VTFSRVWCHGAFLLTDGAKMAKRVGNVMSVQVLREEKFSAAALRHFVFNTHYRKELNLSDERWRRRGRRCGASVISRTG